MLDTSDYVFLVMVIMSTQLHVIHWCMSNSQAVISVIIPSGNRVPWRGILLYGVSAVMMSYDVII